MRKTFNLCIAAILCWSVSVNGALATRLAPPNSIIEALCGTFTFAAIIAAMVLSTWIVIRLIDSEQ